MSGTGCILNDRLASNLELAEVARHLVDFVKVQTQRHQAVPGDANEPLKLVRIAMQQRNIRGGVLPIWLHA